LRVILKLILIPQVAGCVQNSAEIATWTLLCLRQWNFRFHKNGPIFC